MLSLLFFFSPILPQTAGFYKQIQKIPTGKICVSPAGIDSTTQDDQDQHHDHCNGDQAAASAAVPAATAARRATKVVVEGRHVLGVARGTLAEQP